MGFLGQAQELAERLEATIADALPGDVSVRAQLHPKNGRIRISPVDVSDPLVEAALPLYGKDALLAHWSFVMFAEASEDGFLKAHH